MNLEDLNRLDALDALGILNAVRADGCWPPLINYSEDTCPLALALARGTPGNVHVNIHVNEDAVVVKVGANYTFAKGGAVYDFVTWVDGTWGGGWG